MNALPHNGWWGVAKRIESARPPGQGVLDRALHTLPHKEWVYPSFFLPLTGPRDPRPVVLHPLLDALSGRKLKIPRSHFFHFFFFFFSFFFCVLVKFLRVLYQISTRLIPNNVTHYLFLSDELQILLLLLAKYHDANDDLNIALLSVTVYHLTLCIYWNVDLHSPRRFKFHKSKIL